MSSGDYITYTHVIEAAFRSLASLKPNGKSPAAFTEGVSLPFNTGELGQQFRHEAFKLRKEPGSGWEQIVLRCLQNAIDQGYVVRHGDEDSFVISAEGKTWYGTKSTPSHSHQQGGATSASEYSDASDPETPIPDRDDTSRSVTPVDDPSWPSFELPSFTNYDELSNYLSSVTGSNGLPMTPNYAPSASGIDSEVEEQVDNGASEIETEAEDTEDEDMEDSDEEGTVTDFGVRDYDADESEVEEEHDANVAPFADTLPVSRPVPVRHVDSASLSSLVDADPIPNRDILSTPLPVMEPYPIPTPPISPAYSLNGFDEGTTYGYPISNWAGSVASSSDPFQTPSGSRQVDEAAPYGYAPADWASSAAPSGNLLQIPSGSQQVDEGMHRASVPDAIAPAILPGPVDLYQVEAPPMPVLVQAEPVADYAAYVADLGQVNGGFAQDAPELVLANFPLVQNEGNLAPWVGGDAAYQNIAFNGNINAPYMQLPAADAGLMQPVDQQLGDLQAALTQANRELQFLRGAHVQHKFQLQAAEDLCIMLEQQYQAVQYNLNYHNNLLGAVVAANTSLANANDMLLNTNALANINMVPVLNQPQQPQMYPYGPYGLYNPV